VVAALLRSPLHRVASGQLLLITYTGRRTGRSFTTPAMYARTGDDLVVHVAHAERKVWWRNLRGGAPVRVRLRGRDYDAEAEVVTGDASLEEAYLARFPRERERVDEPAEPIFVRLSDLQPVR